MLSKSELRINAKKTRDELNIKEISGKILKNFLACNLYNNAKNIAVYYPFGTEIDIRELFNNKEKNYYLPKISQSGNKMDFYLYKQGDELEKNRYGICEPTGVGISPEKIDLFIIPALMADYDGNRLGYGKGYYDKFLRENVISAPKIILIPDELLTEKLPVDGFDIPVNTIFTQSKVINI